MEPVLKGWVWEFAFYPVINNRRPLKDIFWYDSSDPLMFTQFTEQYQILLPEHLIQGKLEDKEYVRQNKDKLIETKRPIVQTDNNGRWYLQL